MADFYTDSFAEEGKSCLAPATCIMFLANELTTAAVAAELCDFSRRKLNINWIQASVAKRLEMVLLHTALNLWTCTPTCKNPMTSPRFVCRPGRLRVCASTFPRFVRDVM